MLIEVGDFCERVDRGLPFLLDELEAETGRTNPEEREAWSHSFLRLCVALNDPLLSNFHIYLSERTSLALEYRLPASASWCDVVLLGRGEQRPCAAILELKDWDTNGDRPGPREALIEHHGSLTLHPSDQVRGYVEYCRNFHSTVQADGADIFGCVLFTGQGPLDAYLEFPHQNLIARFPVYSTEFHVGDGIVSYLCSRLKRPDSAFATRFVEGRYEQDHTFIVQVAKTIQDPTQSPFVLLDEQRRGFEFCMSEIDRMLGSAQASRKKHVIVVEGPPGSGKSVLAAHLWATLAQDSRISGNVVLTTTSGCQRSIWQNLYEQTRPGGEGIVIPSNQYNPGLTSGWIKEQRGLGRATSVSDWRDNYRRYVETKTNRTPDDTFQVSIVDEAHALIDPTAPRTEGVKNAGWCMQAGPQAWHIIRSSRITVFLMDSEQSYRDNETTTRSNIEFWANEFGADRVEAISLRESQFRCGGSTEYVNWLQFTLGLPTKSQPTTSWSLRFARVGGGFREWRADVNRLEG